MHETVITVTGNLTADPEIRTTARGDVFATFGLACTERRRDSNGTWGDGHTNFVRVTAFRALGQNVMASLSRGNRVVVQGRLRVSNWESGERRGTSVEIDAHSVGADLSFAHVTITKGVASTVPDRMDAAEVRAALEGDATTEGWGGAPASGWGQAPSEWSAQGDPAEPGQTQTAGVDGPDAADLGVTDPGEERLDDETEAVSAAPAYA